MKWSVSTLAGLGVAVATASAMPVPDASTCTPDDVILQCATQTYNEVATYDDLSVNTILTRGGEYQHLSWDNVTVQTGHNVAANSAPNYGFSGPYDGTYTLGPNIGLGTTNTTSFDLHDAWLACVTPNPSSDGTYIGTPCRVNLDCATDLNAEGHEGPFIVSYTPAGADGTTEVELMHVQPGFTYCYDAFFEVISADVGTENAYLVTDSIGLTAREGEVFAGN